MPESDFDGTQSVPATTNTMTNDTSNSESTSDAERPSFEAAMSALQEVVVDLEDGEIGLEESMRRFEQGMGLLRHCYALLEDAEQRIEILSGRDADGNPVTEPFDASATHEASAPRAGRRKQSSASAGETSEEIDGRSLF